MVAKTKGFTLIELMIAVAILGVLSAVAMSSYAKYTQRSYVSEALIFLSSARSAVFEFHSSNGSWPQSAEEAGFDGTPGSDLIATITTADGGIDVTFKAPANLSGEILSLRAGVKDDASIVWICGHSDVPGVAVVAASNNTSLAESALPHSCR